MSDEQPVWGGVEGGGTKFVAVVCNHQRDVLAEVTLPTQAPSETLRSVAEFFLPWQTRLRGVGVGMFGPLDVTGESGAAPGTTLLTPKAGWDDVPVGQALREALDVPVAVDTDVNAAALAEWRWGAGQGCETVIYVTVGTGLGVGIVLGGRPHHGRLHPEGGHIPVPRARDNRGGNDSFEGVCRFHKDCLEGMASGTAFDQRLGSHASAVPQDQVAWQYEAHYLGHLSSTLMLLLAPHRIIFGGGLMQVDWLLTEVQRATKETLANYPMPSFADSVDEVIVPAGLGSRAGAFGGIFLAGLGSMGA